ncbi:MAG: hypothetical protein MUF24_14550 [Chitinophagaceae bacterium]|jgi:hypothetical protein|nr:hypothetical protein [Chitinophagaceae bacterium]
MFLSAEFYGQLLDGLNNLHFQEKPGIPTDMLFISDEFWLQDTAVIDHINPMKGMHGVSLIFAHHLNPYKFICRYITAYADARRAATSAHYMRRQAAKDQRGTLKVSANFFNLNMS